MNSDDSLTAPRELHLEELIFALQEASAQLDQHEFIMVGSSSLIPSLKIHSAPPVRTEDIDFISNSLETGFS